MRPQTRLDLRADAILADLTSLDFDLATTAAEVDAVLRLRYECVVELGWAQSRDFPDGRERDGYDEGATFVVCRSEGTLIGAARLVPPLPGRRLLVEEEFGVSVRPPGQALEAGRLVVPARHRSRGTPSILSGLFARGWLAARELGFDRVVGQATAELVGLYRGLGLTVSPLGPSRTYFGEERIPIEVSSS